jgi:hypothetical protein
MYNYDLSPEFESHFQTNDSNSAFYKLRTTEWNPDFNSHPLTHLGVAAAVQFGFFAIKSLQHDFIDSFTTIAEGFDSKEQPELMVACAEEFLRRYNRTLTDLDSLFKAATLEMGEEAIENTRFMIGFESGDPEVPYSFLRRYVLNTYDSRSRHLIHTYQKLHEPRIK